MKRIVTIVIFSLLAAAAVAFGEDQQSKNFSGWLNLKSDYVFNGTSSAELRLETYLKYKKTFGLGLDTEYTPMGFHFVKPYLGVSTDQWTVIGGYAADSNNVQYAFGGVLYNNMFGKMSVCLDVRNWYGLNNKADSFQDNFMELTYPVARNISVGVDGVYDHYWSNKLDFALVGPIVYFKVNDSIKLFARYTREWGITPVAIDPSDRIRLGVTFLF